MYYFFSNIFLKSQFPENSLMKDIWGWIKFRKISNNFYFEKMLDFLIVESFIIRENDSSVFQNKL